jgi:peroxiredoxin
MKILFKILILFSALLLTVSGSGKDITCKLKGEIIGRDCNTLILMKATEDVTHGSRTLIPIKDGKFEYTLKITYTETYCLIFQDELDMGSWRPVYFFPENDTTVFRLRSMKEFELNEIIGGKLTFEYNNYFRLNKDAFLPQKQAIRDSIAVLKKRDEYFSAEFKLQQDKLSMAMAKTRAENSSENDQELAVIQTQVVQKMIDRGEFVTPKGKVFNDKMDSLTVLRNRLKLNYIENNPSLVSYYFLIELIKDLEVYRGVTVSDIKTIAPKFTEKYPDHPYTKMMAVMIESLLRIRVGEKYIDFSAPGINGKLCKLSEIIDGKFAVIDLWASWCGPCIIGSRDLLPIYEEFKEKGFTVCGIAREYKNTDALKNRIDKEKFPWTNLVELDDKNQIWLQYGVQGGGRKFLVDNKGIILAIDPGSDEIRKLLSEKLKN